MDTLDDNCLLIILEKLSLPDQLSLMQVHSRSRELLPRVWRKMGHQIEINLLETQVPNADFEYFLQHCCGIIEKLILTHMDAQKLEILKRFHYPEATHIELLHLPPYFYKSKDTDIFQKIFPQVKIACQEVFDLRDVNSDYWKQFHNGMEKRMTKMILSINSSTVKEPSLL